jgi:hypothetical protein
MTASGRVLHASLDLLDRQLLDRNGIECGNVDDLELTRAEDGTMYVTAILSGPGRLWYRLGRRRLGRWLQHAQQEIGSVDETDRSRIPMDLAHNIGSSIDIAVDHTELANHALERWTTVHLISHIPGHDHDADK